MNEDHIPRTEIKLGIIGGGTRCKMLLEMFEKKQFKDFNGSIAAVADINPDASGMVKAREMGVDTMDTRSLLDREDLDLVLELTGDEKVRQSIERLPAPATVWKMLSINKLIYDVLRIRAQELKAEAKLDKNTQFLQTVVDSVQEDIVIIDTNYQIVDINNSTLRSTGLTRKEIIGKPCYQITHHSLTPCEWPDHPCPLQQALETGKPTRASHTHFTHDGTRYYEVAHYPVRDETGAVSLVLEIGRDISDIVNSRLQTTTERIKRDYNRLVIEDKLISMGKLMAGVVHEINNPLTGTLNLARLVSANMKEGIVNEAQLEENIQYLDLIASEIDRTSKIVSNLLFFSRQQPREEVKVNVREVMDRVLTIASHNLKIQQILVSRAYDPDLPEIRFQAGHLDQALMNVVFNAIEAMPYGGELDITLLRESSDKVKISVKDTGYGIKEEDMSKIFEPFFSTKGQAKGVGLGLSVVHGIINAHEGTIHFNSEPGEGAECVIILPIERG